MIGQLLKALATLAALLHSLVFAGTPVTTAQYGPQRLGSMTTETAFSATNVNPVNFGLLGSYPTDVNNLTYAQPLYLPGVVIGGGTKNLLVIVNQANTIYAFDGDCFPISGACLVWSLTSATLGAPRPFNDYPTGVATGQSAFNYTGSMGCMSTPVADLAANRLYAICSHGSGSGSTWVLYAINLSTGAVANQVTLAASVTVPSGNGDIYAGNQDVNRQNNTLPTTCGSFAGFPNGLCNIDTISGTTLSMNSPYVMQRAPLLLTGGKIYIAMSSYDDQHPMHGWVLAYDQTALTLVSAICTTPTDPYAGGTIWHGGGGLAADAGGIYAITGNGGNANITGGITTATNYSDSYIKLNLSTLAVTDFFTPPDYVSRDQVDCDLASAMPILVNGLMISGSKSYSLYTVSTSSMGQISSGVQHFYTDPTKACGAFLGITSVVYLIDHLYVGTNAGAVYSYVWNGSSFNLQLDPGGSGNMVGNPQLSATLPGGATTSTMSASANGSSNRLIWVTTPTGSAFSSAKPGTLHVLDGLTLTELYNSSQHGTRDTLGTYAKWTPPVLGGNGRVYVNTNGAIQVYGIVSLLGNVAAATAIQSTF